MKRLLPLLLIIVLPIACASFSDVEVSSKVPSQTPTPIISVIATPSLIPFPSSTLPPDCGTTKLGKPGTQIKETNHSVLVEGTAILCNYGSLFEDYPTVIPLREAMFDLDSGSTNIESADIGFGVGGKMRFYYLSEVNNALVSVWSLSGITMEHPPQPTFDQCKQQVNLFNNDNEPEYVCVITNEGQIARVKVEKYDPVEQAASLEISFITWNELAAKP